MTRHTISTKLFTIGLLFLLLGSTVMAFPHSILGDAAASPDAKPLTVAGQVRQCSQYPDETGTFIGARTITSKTLPALVNVYYVNSNGGWTYYNEFEAPVAFSGANRAYAYEVYYCPTQTTAACTAGKTRAVTETTYQQCVNGQWSATQKCAGLFYFSPQAGKCISPECKEQWTCESYGECTQDGVQYRTCKDVHSCGTYDDRPKTSQLCNPVLSTGGSAPGSSGTTGDGLRLVGQPMVKSLGNAGDPVVVEQTFNVIVPGQYWVEAGLEQVRGLSVADIEHNTCNPAETWYKNQLVSFDRVGQITKTFSPVPAADGEYVLHTAIVTGCGGDIVSQSNAVDKITIGNPDSGKGAARGYVKEHLLLIGGIAGVIVLVAGVFVYMRRR